MWFYIMLADLGSEDQDFVIRIYEQYGGYMYKQAYSILNNQHDAEDAVQDVMIKIIRHLMKFEGNTDNEIRNKVVICIRAAITNKAIDHYKNNKKRNEHEVSMYYKSDDDEYNTINIEDTSVDLDRIAITKETQEIIKNAIVQLSQPLQDALNLVYIEGFSCVEAADFLGITDVAVRARIFKARKKLAEMLGGKFGEQN